MDWLLKIKLITNYSIKKVFVFFYVLNYVLMSLSSQDVPTTTQSFNIDGIWENKSVFIEIVNSNEADINISLTFKPFYQYWYDGIYFTKYIPDQNSIVRIDNGLYLEYWEKGSANEDNESKNTEGFYWRPCGNLKEISLDKPKIQQELTGYYVLNTEDNASIYAIRYWISSVDYSNDQASFTTNNIEKPEEITLLVDKYLNINGTVYTCATGRRSVIRNVKLLSKFPGTPLYSQDNTIMVLNSPYLVLSKINDIQAEITKHNSIIYPPHSGEAKFEEPSVYKKIENNELPLNGGSYFKSGFETLEDSDVEN
ncbi:MAG: hypothetical protein BKP49_09290 [Treponema sp. CETP13]|nr:MAG: hypothetical protein BKP49_09290 [Treponema sp. CETP13]